MNEAPGRAERAYRRASRMRVWDDLPRDVRIALAAARYAWPVHEIQERLADGQSEASVIRLIRDLDDQTLERRRRA